MPKFKPVCPSVLPGDWDGRTHRHTHTQTMSKLLHPSRQRRWVWRDFNENQTWASCWSITSETAQYIWMGVNHSRHLILWCSDTNIFLIRNCSGKKQKNRQQNQQQENMSSSSTYNSRLHSSMESWSHMAHGPCIHEYFWWPEYEYRLDRQVGTPLSNDITS